MSFEFFNYLDPEFNIPFKKYLLKVEKRAKDPQGYADSLFNSHDRTYAVQRIFDLHMQKKYRPETLFMAVSIFDQYLACTGHYRFPRRETCTLAVTALLIAVKTREPISPCFDRMVQRLTEEE